MITIFKNDDDPVFVEGHLTGVLEVSAIINEQRVHEKYIGYTVTEAVEIFKQRYYANNNKVLLYLRD